MQIEKQALYFNLKKFYINQPVANTFECFWTAKAFIIFINPENICLLDILHSK